MGSALIKGLLASGLSGEDIIASDASAEKLELLRREIGVGAASSNRELVERSELAFIAVKPDDVPAVLDEIEGAIGEKLLISVAAGISTDFIERKLGRPKVIRLMPNVACWVREGAIAYCPGRWVTAEDEGRARSLLSGLGPLIKLDEGMFDAVTGLSGSGPAYAFLVAEALARAGEEEGIPAGVSRRLAAQTLKGAGEMMLKLDKSAEELIDMVRSPKGATAEGLKVLEGREVAEAIKDAVKAAARRARELAR